MDRYNSSQEICAFCGTNHPDAKNSHYLTDGVIRSALNYNGGESNKHRAKGLSFSLDSSTPFVDFKIQQNTPVEEVEKKLGRSLTDFEIEKGKKNEFTVDNVFCLACETRFGKIETAFTSNKLPFFRNGHLRSRSEYSIEDSNHPNLFFLLQVWRSYVSNEINLKKDTGLVLKEILFEYTETGNIDQEKLKKVPFLVVYLNTEKTFFKDDRVQENVDLSPYTENFVGYTSDTSPKVIFMNDFIIFFYEPEQKINFIDFYGIFSKDDIESYINGETLGCKFKVLSNEQRVNLLAAIREDEVKRKIEMYKYLFYNQWFLNSSLSFQEKFFNIWYTGHIIQGNTDSIETYSEDNIISSMRKTINEINCILRK